MCTKKFTVQCPIRETINNTQCIKFQKRTKVSTGTLYMLCPWSIIVLAMHTESHKYAPVLYLKSLYSEGWLSQFTEGQIFGFLRHINNRQGWIQNWNLWGRATLFIILSFSSEKLLYTIICYIKYCHLGTMPPVTPPPWIQP